MKKKDSINNENEFEVEEEQQQLEPKEKEEPAELQETEEPIALRSGALLILTGILILLAIALVIFFVSKKANDPQNAIKGSEEVASESNEETKPLEEQQPVSTSEVEEVKEEASAEPEVAEEQIEEEPTPSTEPEETVEEQAPVEETEKTEIEKIEEWVESVGLDSRVTVWNSNTETGVVLQEGEEYIANEGDKLVIRNELCSITLNCPYDCEMMTKLYATIDMTMFIGAKDISVKIYSDPEYEITFSLDTSNLSTE